MQLVKKKCRTEPQPRRWTAKEYYRLLDLGFFQDQRVELMDGEILVMASQKNLHLAAITLGGDVLRIAFGSGYWVRIQGSLDLSPFSVPDPDIAVVEGSPRNCSEDNPTTALLVVEASDTTLRYDRHFKGSLYARVGIADYWIINLKRRSLEVRREPTPDKRQPFGYRYTELTVLRAGEFVTPLAASHAKIAVADLLP